MVKLQLMYRYNFSKSDESFHVISRFPMFFSKIFGNKMSNFIKTAQVLEHCIGVSSFFCYIGHHLCLRGK